MKYRPDPDLDFLKDCSSQELDILVHVLLRNKEGKQRSIVKLPHHPRYMKHVPNHAAYWEVIAGEIQRYGSNPLAAMARAGRGKHYMKILQNVASRFSIQYLPDASVEVNEREVCLNLFTRALQQIPGKELQSICEAFHITPATITAYGITHCLLDSLRLDDHAECLLFMIVAHGASMHASGIGYTKIAAPQYHPVLRMFEKPLADEFGRVSSLSVTGSAHWIVIPAVLQVAFLRAKKNPS